MTNTIHKGIDDLFAAGGTPTRLTGTQVNEFFQRLRKLHEGMSVEKDSEQAPIFCAGQDPEIFPVEVFPSVVRRFVEQVSKATGCPTDFPAVAALVVSGAAIGAARGLCVKRGWVEQPGMYAAIVAPPGRVKTPALKAVMTPIYETQDLLRQEYRAEVARYREELEAYKRAQRRAPDEIEEILREPSGSPSEPPPLRHLFSSDTTVEALAVNLESNPKGLLIFRDEFSAWVQTMNQYRRGADRQFFLSAWSNEMIKVDRKSDQGGPLVVRHPFLAVIGGVQPDLLPSLEAGGAQDGFLDRLLFAYPAEQPFPGWTDAEMDEGIQHEWRMVLSRLLALEPHRAEGASESPHTLQLNESGKEAFKGFVDDLANEMNTANLPPRIVGVCAKLRGYAARFALIIHFLRWAAGELEEGWGEGCVDEEDVRRAVALCRYFKSHAMVVHGSLRRSEEDKRVEAFLSWMERHGMTEVSPRDVVRANVAGIKKSSDAKRLMEAVADRGYGECEKTGVQKRSVRFMLNRSTTSHLHDRSLEATSED